jgi:hypothetical protein
MNSDISPFLEKVAAAERVVDSGRQLMAAGGDDRARAILDAVNSLDGGTKAVDEIAEALGVKANQVYVAMRRAKTAAQPSGLPHDLLERLYALELADLKPLPRGAWLAAAHALHGVYVEQTWLEQPGHLLAQEAEDLDEDEVPADAVRALAEAARSWTRIQALAVIDALQRGELAALPHKD